ncbi:MAG: AAA family ATPase [Anaerolineae bacterium]|nr:AAA family ATPase [Anaerolineae bacterium]
MPPIAVRLFGYPTIEAGSAPAPVARQRTLALLAYLAATATEVGRDRLAALLWPDYDRDQARAYLRHSLWELRRALGEPHLHVDRRTVRMDTAQVSVDVVEFRRLIRQWRSDAGKPEETLGLLEEAANLYRADFLAGLSLAGSEEFDDWQLLEAEALRRELLQALEALARVALSRGEHGRALSAALRWLQVDPLDERAHRSAMAAYLASGQRSLALRQYQLCAQVLQRELDAEPEPATQALYQQILSATAPSAPVEPVPVAEPARARPFSPPPPPVTPLVGREREMAEIARLLADPDCHLLTLLGQGGVGKTRLALEAAHEMSERFRDGAVVVPLESLPGADHVAGAIASATRVPGAAAVGPTAEADEVTRLLEHLRTREALVVLDGMEHLLDSAPLLERLTASAPQVKVLVTSRERLNLMSEWVLEVRGLACPPSPEAPEHYAACRLFLGAARRNVAGYLPTPDQWPAIVRVCRLVEGLPLGLEMAAAWVRALPVEDIAAELERNLDFPSRVWRGAPERHRSLRAVFEQSWSLLLPKEQQALARLSVFRAGFTREAADAIAAAGPAMLMMLVDKSLLSYADGGRYHLHAVVKQYAAEKLALSPDDERQARGQHCRYCLEMLRQVGAGLMAGGEDTPLALLQAEVPDLEAAWDHAVANRGWELVRGAAAAWALFHEMLGRPEEGLRSFSAAMEPARKELSERPGEEPAALLALLLAVTGRFRAVLSYPREQVSEVRAQSLSLAQELPDGREVAFALLVNSVGAEPSPAAALESCRRSQGIFRASGDRWAEALARLVWADAANLGLHDYEAAWVGYETALAIFSDLGHHWGQALCHNGMAIVATARGLHHEAAHLGREALAIFEQRGDLRRMVETRLLLAQAGWASGRPLAARQDVEAALTAAERSGYAPAVTWLLSHAASLAASHGQHGQAREWLERSVTRARASGDGHAEAVAKQALARL